MFKLIGAEDIIARGVASMAQLRPVLTQQMEAADGFAANATLRKDEWEMIDARVNQVMAERQTIVDDLRGRGLVTPVSLGTVLRVTERVAEFDEAEVSFDGDTAPRADRPDFSKTVIPVPVVSKDFVINWRQLDASRRKGEPLDVTAAGIASRRVRERLQKLITTGLGSGPGANPVDGTTGQSIPSLTTAANRLTYNIGDWNATSANPTIEDVRGMLNAAYAENFFGPFYLYVPKNFWAGLQKDYNDTKGEKTYIERILAYEDIESVRPLDSLADGAVVMVQMTEDVIDLTEAQAPTTVQWEKNPFVTNFRVLTVAGPHIKESETPNGTKTGIVHGT